MGLLNGVDDDRKGSSLSDEDDGGKADVAPAGDTDVNPDGDDDDEDSDQAESSPFVTSTVPFLLYRPGYDELKLTGLVCLLRRQIEVFAATAEDVAARSCRGGLKAPIGVGRVGIRCRHCVHIPNNDRSKGAVSYPKSVQIVPQSFRNWQRYHFKTCPHIPDGLKAEFDEMKSLRSHSRNRSLKYWIDSCVLMGMVDHPGGDGIRFCRKFKRAETERRRAEEAQSEDAEQAMERARKRQRMNEEEADTEDPSAEKNSTAASAEEAPGGGDKDISLKTRLSDDSQVILATGERVTVPASAVPQSAALPSLPLAAEGATYGTAELMEATIAVTKEDAQTDDDDDSGGKRQSPSPSRSRRSARQDQFVEADERDARTPDEEERADFSISNNKVKATVVSGDRKSSADHPADYPSAHSADTETEQRGRQDHPRFAPACPDSPPPRKDDSEARIEKPKRPMFAYNFFFCYERAKLLSTESRGKDSAETADSSDTGSCDDDPKPPRRPTPDIDEVRYVLKNNPFHVGGQKNRAHRGTHGKIGFLDLVRHISALWRSTDFETRNVFQKLAVEEGDRYRREIAAYKTRTESGHANQQVVPRQMVTHNAQADAAVQQQGVMVGSEDSSEWNEESDRLRLVAPGSDEESFGAKSDEKEDKDEDGDDQDEDEDLGYAQVNRSSDLTTNGDSSQEIIFQEAKSVPGQEKRQQKQTGERSFDSTNWGQGHLKKCLAELAEQHTDEAEGDVPKNRRKELKMVSAFDDTRNVFTSEKMQPSLLLPQLLDFDLVSRASAPNAKSPPARTSDAITANTGSLRHLHGAVGFSPSFRDPQGLLLSGRAASRAGAAATRENSAALASAAPNLSALEQRFCARASSRHAPPAICFGGAAMRKDAAAAMRGEAPAGAVAAETEFKSEQSRRRSRHRDFAALAALAEDEADIARLAAEAERSEAAQAEAAVVAPLEAAAEARARARADEHARRLAEARGRAAEEAERRRRIEFEMAVRVARRLRVVGRSADEEERDFEMLRKLGVSRPGPFAAAVIETDILTIANRREAERNMADGGRSTAAATQAVTANDVVTARERNERLMRKLALTREMRAAVGRSGGGAVFPVADVGPFGGGRSGGSGIFGEPPVGIDVQRMAVTVAATRTKRCNRSTRLRDGMKDKLAVDPATNTAPCPDMVVSSSVAPSPF